MSMFELDGVREVCDLLEGMAETLEGIEKRLEEIHSILEREAIANRRRAAKAAKQEEP